MSIRKSKRPLAGGDENFSGEPAVLLVAADTGLSRQRELRKNNICNLKAPKVAERREDRKLEANSKVVSMNLQYVMNRVNLISSFQCPCSGESNCLMNQIDQTDLSDSTLLDILRPCILKSNNMNKKERQDLLLLLLRDCILARNNRGTSPLILLDLF